MKTNYHTKPNSLFLILLCIILGIYCCQAQGIQRVSVIGTEFSTGTHRFLFEDHKIKLSNLSPLTKGVSFGFYAGNNLVNLRIRGGYYISPRKVQVEVIVTEYDMLLDIYPLEFIRTKDHVLDVYLTAGYSINWIKIRADKSSYQDFHPTLSSLPGKGNYQVLGMGFKFIPRIGKRRTYFFAEALIYNDLSNKEPVNVFTNVGFKRTLLWKIKS